MWGNPLDLAHFTRWLVKHSKMAQPGHRVLSEHPLNSEPSSAALVSAFLTPTASIYSRNHGEIRSLPDNLALRIFSEVEGVSTTLSSIPLADLKALPKEDVVSVLACAGNRRVEMDEEKEVEGLKWGGSAVANCHFGGEAVACSAPYNFVDGLLVTCPLRSASSRLHVRSRSHARRLASERTGETAAHPLRIGSGMPGRQDLRRVAPARDGTVGSVTRHPDL